MSAPQPARPAFVGAAERLFEKRGAKILLVGPTGVGKTSLLRTLEPDPRCSSTSRLAT
jgi:putative ribosome biogenesis GTPase RsgA